MTNQSAICRRQAYPKRSLRQCATLADWRDLNLLDEACLGFPWRDGRNLGTQALSVKQILHRGQAGGGQESISRLIDWN
ncbi:MAG: hypothetical protein AAF530_25515 [Pseudomonadota bacterium]